MKKNSKPRRPAPKKSKAKARRNANAQARRAEKKAAALRIGDAIEVELFADGHIGGHGLPRGFLPYIFGPTTRGKTLFANGILGGDPFRTVDTERKIDPAILAASRVTVKAPVVVPAPRATTGAGFPVDPVIALAWSMKTKQEWKLAA